MSSNNPNAPPSGYQIGAGALVNQQYFQPRADSSNLGLHSGSQQQLPHGQPGTYAPPPAPHYEPGAPDLQDQDSQKHTYSSPQYMMSGGNGASSENHQPYYPPPPHQPNPEQLGYGSQQQFHPPPQQGFGDTQAHGHVSQQHFPPPSEQAPGDFQSPGKSSQQHPSSNPDGYSDVAPPPQPPRPNQQIASQTPQQTSIPSNTLMTTASGGYPVPPRRHSAQLGDDDPSSPIHYTRDPHKLVAYLVPFPKPQIKGVAPAAIPDRFLIYTPPPPPLSPPKEGEKEDKLHKVQRKWQEEVRAAKTSEAKTASWKGVKSKATRGISYVMSKTTTSNLDFVNRIPGAKADTKDKHADDGVNEGDTTHKTVGLEEMILVYPSSYGASPDQVKTEFVNTMMRTKSKAQKDAVLATGLLPVTAAIDFLATVIWPFGGLLEVDGVWAYSSIRGAKTARSVTKRLSSSTHSGNTHNQTEEQEMQGEKLQMIFTQSPRLEVLYRYLLARCKDYDHKHFPSTDVAPTETEVLSAIGWAPSQTGNVNKNWEDEEWETQEVKDDMKSTLGKAGKEWDKWCQAFAKDPEKALKK